MNLTNCVHKILVCSTVHITRNDHVRFQIERALPGLHDYERVSHGWLITVEARDHVTDIGAWQLAGWSDSLYHLINNALHRKCKYVRLDSDAEQVTGWATHDW